MSVVRISDDRYGEVNKGGGVASLFQLDWLEIWPLISSRINRP